MSVVGFDVGNENSYIATARAGGIEMIENEYSFRSTPTYVAFTERSREFGVAAKNKLVSNLENTIFGFKKILGRKFHDPVTRHELAYLPFEVCELPLGDVGIKVKYLNKNIVFSVQQVMAMILVKMKTLSEIKLGMKVRDCVISVPVYYTDVERRAMLNAAEIAGLNTLRLMNESTAVALAYGFYKQDLSNVSKNVIFVDLGNSALTVTACAFSKEKLRILGCVWDRNIGGRDFDNVLVKYFVEDFKTRYNLDVMSSKRAVMTLMLECEALKKQMSANPLELGINIECFMSDIDVSGRMKRETFEKLTAHLLLGIETTFKKLLDEIQLKIDDIDSVQIVGGSCRLPALKTIIARVFGQEPVSTLNQDEAVARGCALQCALLSPTLKTRNFAIDDVQPYPIKISWKSETVGGDGFEIFPRFHKFPASKMLTFAINRQFSIDAYYDEPGISASLPQIGQFIIKDVPSTKNMENARIKVRLGLNIHGIFFVNSASLIGKLKPCDCSESDAEQPFCEVSEKSDTSVTEDIEKLSCEVKAEGEEIEAKSKSVASYDLVISPTCLLSFELNDLIKKEQQMINIDLQEKEKADARNVLEEYMYDMRGKLKDELSEYVLEEQRNKLLAFLNEVENWLYETEDRQTAEYSSRLSELRKCFDPIFTKFLDWQQRPLVIKTFVDMLSSSDGTLSLLSTGKAQPGSESEDIKSLRDMWQEKKEFLDRCLTIFENLQKHADIPYTVDMIRRQMVEFENYFKRILNKFKKEAAGETNTTEGGGDTSIQNEYENDVDMINNNVDISSREKSRVDEKQMSEEQY
ncbi:97 kDa heat shock protein-like [Stegodyphus dumicola]|uniref:97 kDa heat shock protein-like n=1 Tax=Stegodyphus dumicola TaxID=202533 RepID=UPI0015AF2EF8|nr:97 kDa heat shock protein-like [Stegodyphus dumicola]